MPEGLSHRISIGADQKNKTAKALFCLVAVGFFGENVPYNLSLAKAKPLNFGLTKFFKTSKLTLNRKFSEVKGTTK